METLREATPRPPAAGRREVHRATGPRRPEEVLPVHRHRRLHPTRVLRAYSRDQKTAVAFIDHVLSKLPSPSTSRPTTAQSSGSSFHWHLVDKGIGHVRIKPRTPRLNGKVERSHRIDSEELCRLLEGEVIDDANLLSENDSKSGRLTTTTIALTAPSGGQTPYERLRQKARPAVIGVRQFTLPGAQYMARRDGKLILYGCGDRYAASIGRLEVGARHAKRGLLANDQRSCHVRIGRPSGFLGDVTGQMIDMPAELPRLLER